MLAHFDQSARFCVHKQTNTHPTDTPITLPLVRARTRGRVIGVSVGCLLPRAHACARGRAFVWLAFVFVVLSSMSSGT